MEGYFKEFHFPIFCINCYGPYCNPDVFWNMVESSGFLDSHNLIMAGDFNFTLAMSEVWGATSRPDPMGLFFGQLF